MMVEQPLGWDDIVDHAVLQRALRTPICLDESIRGPYDARKAIELGACRIVNIKPARVGGPAMAKAVHDVCKRAGVPVWCGGLLETGIGRAHNIAVAALPGFSLPGDISGSDRYYARDVIDPPVAVSASGMIDVPQGPGLGYGVAARVLESYTVRTIEIGA
jgi:O-succinylbenzoate synthase